MWKREAGNANYGAETRYTTFSFTTFSFTTFSFTTFSFNTQ